MYYDDYSGSRDFSDVSAIQALQILTHFRKTCFVIAVEERNVCILQF